VATLVTYPTQAHEHAAAAITEFFAARDETDAVLLTNSCARGKATPDSCLDMQVVVRPHAVASMEDEFGRFAARSAEIAELRRAGRFSDLHLDVSDGVVTLAPIMEEGISWSEVVVGTFFVYAVPLHVNGGRYENLRSEWLRSHSPVSSTSTSANELGPSSAWELGPSPEGYAAASSATSASTVSGWVTPGFDSMNTAATIAPRAASAAST
jgi:hypothetical protein